MQSSVEAGGGRAIRIAIITKSLERGGTEMHLLRVLPRLLDNGIDLRLHALQRGGVLEADFARSGVSVTGTRRTGRRLVDAARSAVDLAKFLRAFKPDVAHYFLPEPYLIGSVISPFAGSPLRLMSRRSLAVYQTKYPLVALLERLAHRGTAALLGNSKAVVEELLAETARRDNVGLLANGTPVPPEIGAEKRSALRRTLGIPADALTIIIVANLIPYKGHADLLDALALVKEKMPRSWRLLAVGRDGGIMDSLKQRAVEIGLSDHILWLGERGDVPDLLQIADLAVLASHEEGSPNSLIEAMMCGLPVVATAVGGCVDIVETGAEETGLLVAARDAKAFGAAIARIADDAKRRELMGRRARLRAQERFSLEACAAGYVALYRALSALSSRPVQEILDRRS